MVGKQERRYQRMITVVGTDFTDYGDSAGASGGCIVYKQQ